MSTTSVTEFLNELDEKDSITTLQSCYSHKSALIFKTDASPNAVKATIESFTDKKVVLSLENNDTPVTTEVVVSIKFNIGTEIYFVKAPLKKYLNKVYFDQTTRVIQLKRRKEPRYQIPKKWTQTAAVLNPTLELRSVKVNVVDISLSGIRLEVLQELNFCKMGDTLKFQFQIYKRAEIVCEGIVRFVLTRKGSGPIIGIEFTNLKDNQKERIANIVEDLVMFTSNQKS